jgi:hypothetical protein
LNLLTDDDKRKLASSGELTGDAEVVQKVVKKLGLFNANGTPADDYRNSLRTTSFGSQRSDFISSSTHPRRPGPMLTRIFN